MKKSIIAALVVLGLLALMSVPLNAQTYEVSKFQFGKVSASDSASYSAVHYFKIPAGAKLDTTVQIILWQSSTLGDVHAAISYKYAMNLGGSKVLSGNNTVLSADYTTEAVSSWEAAPHADDDAENAADAVKPYNTIAVTVAAAAGNRQDMKYGVAIAYIPLFKD